MEKNKEKDIDKILGMNRAMFFIIVILLCILSLSIGIYAQVFYRYSDTDPFMLGIGVGKTQDAAEITELKNNFNKIFTNDLSGTTSKSVKKKEEGKEIVFTLQTANQKEANKYNISAYIPKINIESDYAEKINAQIKTNYIDKIDSIIEGKNKSETDYSVTYKAYLNGDLLSLIIKESVREGKNTQAVKIKTYNYNLNNNTEVSILELVDAKGYTQKNLQKEIDAEIKDLEKKDEELKSQFADVRLRDLTSDIYKIENTENYMVNENGFLYLIYAYGNKENTNKMDIIIFE